MFPEEDCQLLCKLHIFTFNHDWLHRKSRLLQIETTMVQKEEGTLQSKRPLFFHLPAGSCAAQFYLAAGWLFLSVLESILGTCVAVGSALK